jgi:hypothetical protein
VIQWNMKVYWIVCMVIVGEQKSQIFYHHLNQNLKYQIKLIIKFQILKGLILNDVLISLISLCCFRHNAVSSKNLNVQTEKSNSNLLKTLQKTRFKRALESPWVQSLKNICDPDDESDTEEKVLQPTKLNFEDDKNSNEENQSESSNTNCSNKNVPSNTGVSKVVKKTKPKQNKAVLKEQQNNVLKSYSFLASLSGMIYKYQLL